LSSSSQANMSLIAFGPSFFDHALSNLFEDLEPCPRHVRPYRTGRRGTLNFAKDQVSQETNLSDFTSNFQITQNENSLSIALDASSFQPSELKVELEQNFLVIRGLHEEESE